MATNFGYTQITSMLGKWAQNQNNTQTTIVDSEKEFYELLTCPGTEVTNLIFPNDDVAWVSWKYSEDNIAVGKNVNVAVAAYVTTQARLKLYGNLSILGESFLYCDTYSVIFVQNDNDPPKFKTVDYLGDLTMRWGCTALASLWKNLCRVVQKTMRFRYFAPRPHNVQKSAK